MNGDESGILVQEIARDIVADVAPQELPIFPAVSTAYLANPAGALRLGRRSDPVLGFGAEAVTALLTTAVMYILSEVLKILAEAARKAATDGLSKEGTALVAAMFKRFRTPAAPALGETELAAIQSRIVSAGRELRLTDDKIDLLVKAVSAQLATKET